MDWIDLAKDRDQWRALVKRVMNLWVPVQNVVWMLSRIESLLLLLGLEQ
jgi:hypothetical protein